MLEVLREFWNRNKKLVGNEDQQEEKEKTRNLAKERLNISTGQSKYLYRFYGNNETRYC